MISRTQRENLAQEVADVYAGIEDQILFNIADRIKKHNSLLTDEGYEAWQMIMLSELDMLDKQQLQTIVENSGVVMSEVTRVLQEAGYSSAESLTDEVQQAIDKGAQIYNPSSTPIGIIDNVVNAYTGQALDKLNLTNSTMLGTSADAYRQILNTTVAQVAAGTMTSHQALRKAISEAAVNGVSGLIDRAGRHWTPEAYVNMVMRSTLGNTARQAQEAGMDHHGIELIEVSSHMGARPLCAPYQGRIFSREGYFHPEYDNITTTSIGEPAGLFGINCGHMEYPYFEGVSIQRNRPVDTEANDQAYKESQAQRRIERFIRATKREAEMLRRAGDAEGAALANKSTKRYQLAMREFIEETGRTRRRNREQIYSS